MTQAIKDKGENSIIIKFSGWWLTESQEESRSKTEGVRGQAKLVIAFTVSLGAGNNLIIIQTQH